MATKKTTDLASVENFAIANIYDGMDEELLEELKDELQDLDADTGITCRMIKVPAGGQLAFEVEGEDDDLNYEKEIVGVIVFTHRINGYWPGTIDDGDKVPACASNDGKTGVDRFTGEVRHCDTCPYNQYGSADKGNGKACKNMRRIYLLMNGDPNLYMLSVPPTSIRDVNRKLARIMGSKGIPYTGMIVSLKLEKVKNADGIEYSKILLAKSGLLNADASAAAKKLRQEVKQQYANYAITLDDYGVPDESGSAAASPAAPAAPAAPKSTAPAESAHSEPAAAPAADPFEFLDVEDAPPELPFK